MKKKPTIYFLPLWCMVFLLTLPYLSAQPSSSLAEKAETADRTLADLIDQKGPGFSVAMMMEGKIVYQKNVGMANLEYDIPIDSNTRFHVASLSKQFTAFAILLLQKEGKLSLDDDIRKHIPEVPDFGAPITLRHLATHTSGLRDQWHLLALAGWRSDDVFTNDQILKFVVRQKELNFTPGEKLWYSNTGFTLLAEVVQRVSGKSFADFMEQRVFQPLGMSNSCFYDDHQKILPGRAYSYRRSGEELRNSRLNFSVVGPTSLFSTTDDLCKWSLNFTNPILGGKALIDQMNTLMVLNNGEVSEAALGQFGKVKYKGLEWLDHTGSDAGYRAYLGRFPEHNSAVVVMANEAGISASSIGLTLVEIYLKDYFQESTPRTYKTIEEQPIQMTVAEMEKFSGKYWEPEEFYVRDIYVENDTLIYHRSENSKTKLIPVGPREFKMLNDTEDVSVIFDQNEKGDKQMRLVINDDRVIDYYAFSDTPVSDYPGTYYSEELQTSYQIIVKDETLILQHYRLEDTPLKPIKPNFFTSDKRWYKQLAFIRTSKGSISGLRLSSGGANNIYFKKMKD